MAISAMAAGMTTKAFPLLLHAVERGSGGANREELAHRGPGDVRGVRVPEHAGDAGAYTTPVAATARGGDSSIGRSAGPDGHVGAAAALDGSDGHRAIRLGAVDGVLQSPGGETGPAAGNDLTVRENVVAGCMRQASGSAQRLVAEPGLERATEAAGIRESLALGVRAREATEVASVERAGNENELVGVDDAAVPGRVGRSISTR